MRLSIITALAIALATLFGAQFATVGQAEAKPALTKKQIAQRKKLRKKAAERRKKRLAARKKARDDRKKALLKRKKAREARAKRRAAKRTARRSTTRSTRAIRTSARNTRSTRSRATPRGTKRISRRRKVPAKYSRRTVLLRTPHPVGTVIVDSNRKFLYLVKSRRHAIRYGIGVGREGFGWGDTVRVARKAEWPDWHPPKEMIEREWKQNKRRVGFTPGGPGNPLGARSLYLFKGNRDTQYRIHGTNEPWSIGLNMSSGCIRMMNDDVTHLYNQVKVGAKVVVIGPGGPTRRGTYSTGLFGLGD